MSSKESGPLALYNHAINIGEVKPDPDQKTLILALEALNHALKSYPEIPADKKRLTVKSWRIMGLFRDNTPRFKPRGFYIFGGVGRGKSMLMDMFYDACCIKAKRRVHFHEFMLEVHARLKEWRGLDPKSRVARGWRASDDDPIPPIAQDIARSATLLCFDEMQVSDITDAALLGRLFAELFDHGAVIVTTSNRPPDDLYKDGLNRPVIYPFINRLKAEMDIYSLDGPIDYRLDRLKGVDTYYFPADMKATTALREAFFRLTDRSVDDADKVPSEELVVQGRVIFVPKSARGVAVFSFKRLCGSALGVQDYLSIARHYHTVIMVGIPQMTPDKRNEAIRFRNLIDALYEYGVKFLCSAATAPSDLYVKGDGSFEFQRTVSRLLEMQSQSYLKQGHGFKKALH